MSGQGYNRSFDLSLTGTNTGTFTLSTTSPNEKALGDEDISVTRLRIPSQFKMKGPNTIDATYQEAFAVETESLVVSYSEPAGSSDAQLEADSSNNVVWSRSDETLTGTTFTAGNPLITFTSAFENFALSDLQPTTVYSLNYNAVHSTSTNIELQDAQNTVKVEILYESGKGLTLFGDYLSNQLQVSMSTATVGLLILGSKLYVKDGSTFTEISMSGTVSKIVFYPLQLSGTYNSINYLKAWDNAGVRRGAFTNTSYNKAILAEDATLTYSYDGNNYTAVKEQDGSNYVFRFPVDATTLTFTHLDTATTAQFTTEVVKETNVLPTVTNAAITFGSTTFKAHGTVFKPLQLSDGSVTDDTTYTRARTAKQGVESLLTLACNNTFHKDDEIEEVPQSGGTALTGAAGCELLVEVGKGFAMLEMNGTVIFTRTFETAGWKRVGFGYQDTDELVSSRVAFTTTNSLAWTDREGVTNIYRIKHSDITVPSIAFTDTECTLTNASLYKVGMSANLLDRLKLPLYQNELTYYKGAAKGVTQMNDVREILVTLTPEIQFHYEGDVAAGVTTLKNSSFSFALLVTGDYDSPFDTYALDGDFYTNASHMTAHDSRTLTLKVEIRELRNTNPGFSPPQPLTMKDTDTIECKIVSIASMNNKKARPASTNNPLTEMDPPRSIASMNKPFTEMGRST